MVPAIPAGYHSLTPYLTIADAAAAVDYYVDVFAAEVELRIDMPDGRLGHAELKIGDSPLMIASCDFSVGCSSGASEEDGGYQANPAPESPG